MRPSIKMKVVKNEHGTFVSYDIEGTTNFEKYMFMHCAGDSAVVSVEQYEDFVKILSAHGFEAFLPVGV